MSGQLTGLTLKLTRKAHEEVLKEPITLFGCFMDNLMELFWKESRLVTM